MQSSQLVLQVRFSIKPGLDGVTANQSLLVSLGATMLEGAKTLLVHFDDRLHKLMD